MVVSTPTIINENADYSGIETDGDGGAFHNIGDMTVNGGMHAVNNAAMSKGGLFYNDGNLTFNGTLLAESSGDIYNGAGKVLTFAGGSCKFGNYARTPVANDGEMILGASGNSTAISLKNVSGSGTLTVGGTLFVTVDPSVSLADATGELQLIEASDYTGASFTDAGVPGGYTIEDMGDGKFIICRAPDPTPSSSSDAAASVYGVRATADWRGAFTTYYRDNTASLSLRFDF